MPHTTNAHPVEPEPIEAEVSPGERPPPAPTNIGQQDPDLAAVAASAEPTDPDPFTDYEPI